MSYETEKGLSNPGKRYKKINRHVFFVASYKNVITHLLPHRPAEIKPLPDDLGKAVFVKNKSGFIA